MIDKYTLRGVVPYLTGFLNSQKDGLCSRMHFVNSCGGRSPYKKDDTGYYTHMISLDAQKQIKTVDVYYSSIILGF